MRAKKTVLEVDSILEIYVPVGQLVMKQELAFFLIGSLHEYLNIQEMHVQ